jgi:hypothetical protein
VVEGFNIPTMTSALKRNARVIFDFLRVIPAVGFILIIIDASRNAEYLSNEIRERAALHQALPRQRLNQ